MTTEAEKPSAGEFPRRFISISDIYDSSPYAYFNGDDEGSYAEYISLSEYESLLSHERSKLKAVEGELEKVRDVIVEIEYTPVNERLTVKTLTILDGILEKLK